MTSSPPSPSDSFEKLSALADGELDGAEAAAACALWDREAAARSSWHAYQLIGDVLRSQDLAADPAREVVFLQALRLRLAAESIRRDAEAGVQEQVGAQEPSSASVTVPSPAVAPAPRSFARATAAGSASRTAAPARYAAGKRRWAASWLLGSAVLATFVGVVVFRSVLPEPEGSGGIATGPLPPVTTTAADARTAAGRRAGTEVVSLPADAQGTPPTLLRDPRLDAYLAAHKQFAGTSALGVPSAFLRSATSHGDSKAP